jgi:serine O-acetyltransferase
MKESNLINDLKRFKNLSHTNKLSIKFIILSHVITTSAFRAIFFYRILNKQFQKRGRIFKIIWYFSIILNEIEIPYTAEIGGGLLIPHPKCIFIHTKSIIGKNVTISQGVTIGGNLYKQKNGRRSPIIGDNVLISAGAKILGPVTVGDNSIIGANAVVINDIPPNSVAVGIPANVVKKVDEPYINIMNKYRN